jgi:hypothetical protein
MSTESAIESGTNTGERLVFRSRLDLVKQNGEKLAIADFQGPIGEDMGRKIYKVNSRCGREMFLLRLPNDIGMRQFIDLYPLSEFHHLLPGVVA